MLFLADANIFVPMVEGLRDRGHDVFDVKEKGLENLSDPEIFRMAMPFYQYSPKSFLKSSKSLVIL